MPVYHLHLKRNLLGMKAGESKEFTLAAADAFGEPLPENIHYMDISKFSEEAPAKVGNIITFSQPGGELPWYDQRRNGQFSNY